ncbi:MAG TPA: response regulator transcription factor [Bacteroidota bacterium]|nr:response regulator transcription factor [Bacteroidota bacterium]
MKNPVHVLIADDHPLFRAGVRSVLAHHPDIKIVGESSDGHQTLQSLKSLTPDILVTDLDMPVMGGLALIRAIQDEGSSVAVIVLTMYNEEDMFEEAMDLGVKGYVLKENAVQDIVEALHAVAAGRYYISPSMSDHLMSRTRKPNVPLRGVPDLTMLTAMERRVLNMIADNKTSKEIGAELFISPKTVENHRTNICSKLNLRGSHVLLKFAIENRRHL